MKRIISALILICLTVALVSGCSSENNTAATLGTDELQAYSRFTQQFNDLISKLPDYTIEQKEDSTVNKYVCHLFHIKSEKLGKTYKLRVYTNKDSEIEWVFLLGANDNKGSSQFAELSLCAYKAMNLPATDEKAFNEKFDLLSKEDIFEVDAHGKYDIISMTMSSTNEITFSVRVSDYNNV